MTTVQQNVELEPVGERHAIILYQGLTEPSVYEFVEDRPPSLQELKRRFHAAAKHRSPDDPEMAWFYWAVKAGEIYVGAVEIGVFAHKTAEIGFTTFRPYRSQGIATAAIQLALKEFRKNFPGMPIRASINELNFQSRRVVEKIGFALVKRNVGAEWIKGRPTDELIYVLQ